MNRKGLWCAAVVVFVLASCSKNSGSLNSTEVQFISSESLSEVCVAEASEMSTVILSGLNDSQLGSTPVTIPAFSVTDSLLTGASISVAGTGGMNNPLGTITIDFKKTGTKDLNGITRKGMIIINYSGRRGAVGSTRSISFSGYSRSRVMLDDSMNYVITNLTDSTLTKRNFHHVLKNCKLTFIDQGTFVRNADFLTTVDFVANTTTLKASDAQNSAECTTQQGGQISMKIIEPLVYKPQCIGAKMYLPNQGSKSILAGSSVYTVVYGSTLTCGQKITVTAGDGPQTIKMNADGN